MADCTKCGKPLGRTVYVIEGRLGRYLECEWCFEGVARVELPELITDSFTPPPRECVELDAILDKMTGEGEYALSVTPGRKD